MGKRKHWKHWKASVWRRLGSGVSMSDHISEQSQPATGSLRRALLWFGLFFGVVMVLFIFGSGSAHASTTTETHGVSHATVNRARGGAPRVAVRHAVQLPVPPSSRIGRTQPLPLLPVTRHLPSVTGLPVPPLNRVSVPAPVDQFVGGAPARSTPRWQSPVLPGTATAVVTAPVADPATAQVGAVLLHSVDVLADGNNL
jgi:hypothetical protein